MRNWTIAAASMLALSAAMLPAAASAGELTDLLRAGDRDGAMEAIADADVNEAAADGSTALHYAAYQVDHDLVRALLDAGAKADVTNDYGSTPLSEAVKIGDAELVRMLLDAGADPDSPNGDNQTALMLASNIGSLPIAEMLVEHGADVNAVETFRGQTALMWAAANGHAGIVDLLLEHGADTAVRAKHDDWPRQMTSEPRAQFRDTGGLTALLYATRSGCHTCAVSIVDAGADVNQPNPDGVTPLLNALDNKNFDTAWYLMDNGADIHAWDQYGRTPLYLAVDMHSFNPPIRLGLGGFGGYPEPAELGQEAKYSALDVMDRLIEAGVDVNHQLTRMRPNGPARGRFTDYDMRGGTSALLVAAMSYDNVAIERLLSNGADVDLPNVFRMTPLMIAGGMSGTGRIRGGLPDGDVQAGVIETMTLLLDNGADVNAQVTGSRTKTGQLDTYIQGRDHEGETALFAAANMGWDKVVAFLIERGADPTIRDADGDTALDEAKGAGPAAGGGQTADVGGANRDATIALLETYIADSGAADEEDHAELTP